MANINFRIVVQSNGIFIYSDRGRVARMEAGNGEIQKQDAALIVSLLNRKDKQKC